MHSTTTPDPKLLRGTLLIGADGKQLSADGLAAGPDTAECILRAWRAARKQGRRLFPAEGPDGGPMIVVALQTPEHTALIAMQREGRDALFEFSAAVDFAADIMSHFLLSPFEALAVVDREAKLRYMSPSHERFFGLRPGAGVGRHITEVIENTRLHQVVETGKSEVGLLHEMRGVTRVVSRHPIRNERGEVTGAIGQLMFKGPEQLHALSNETSKLKSEVAYYQRMVNDMKTRGYGLDQIVGNSRAMQRLKQQIIRVAPLDVPVLITGESGTGKELAAHAIHRLGPRRDGNMVMINAAALPHTLVESELFGYEAGSFTGAERKGRKGKVEMAHGGTLFFDEVGDMPADVQVKLLRVLQDGTFQRVGGHEARSSDFRLISASNRNFDAMIAEGTFRLDLFYRIGGVTIRMPSLRERLEDIPLLAELALRRFADRHGYATRRLSAAAIAFLEAQPWPGNVRQLMHVVERAAIFSDAEEIQPHDFGMESIEDIDGPIVAALEPEPLHPPEARPRQPDQVRFTSAVEQVKEDLIRQAMARFNGNKKRVAQGLGISRSYLYRRLAQMESPSEQEG